MNNRQSQRAGENSLQVQADRVTVVQGVTEERAAEIAEATTRQVLDSYHAEGRVVADSRMRRFDGNLVEDFASRGLLGVFSDPGFQVLLRTAQMQAAVTGSDLDLDLLLRLLRQRAEEPATRGISLAIKRAVESLESLDETALSALSLAWTLVQTKPPNTDIRIGLSGRDELFSKLLEECGPPQDAQWLDVLDLTDLADINVSNFGMKGSYEILLGNAPAYVARGLSSDEAASAQAEFDRIVGREIRIVFPHVFSPGASRLDLLNRETWSGAADHLQLSPQQRVECLQLFDSFDAFAPDPDNRNKAIEMIKSEYPSMARVHEWWDSFHDGVTIRFTSAGKALAFSNVVRIVGQEQFPPLRRYLENAR